MKTLLLIIIIFAIIFFAGLYIYNAKKKGQTCIGCPYAKSCGGKCDSNKTPSA